MMREAMRMWANSARREWVVARGSAAWRWCAVFGLVWGVVAGGCVSDEKSVQNRPTQPAWARATNISVTAELPEDRDADGYDDTLYIAVMLFDSSFAASTIKLEGGFVFTLVDGQGKPRVVWEVDEQSADGAWIPAPAGPMCRFRLPIKPEEAKGLAGLTATTLVEFIDKRGERTRSSNGATVTLRKPF